MDYMARLEQGRVGALALKGELGPNLLKGLLISLLVHAVLVGSPYAFLLWKGEPVAPVPVGPCIPPTKLVPLHPVWNRPTQIAIRPEVKDVTFRVPVPVDNEPVERDDLVPTQGDIRDKLGNPSTDLPVTGDGGGVVVWEEPPLEEVIPPSTEFMPVEVLPAALPTNPQPKYPEMARVAGVDGSVTLNVYVDKLGNVKRWEVLKATPAGLGFEEEVLQVIRQWKFTPAIQGERPVGVWVAVPFKFKISH